MWRWTKRLLLLCIPLLVVLGAVAFMYARSVALASLPDVRGVVEVRGVVSTVKVSRDSLGVPLIEAATMEDACFAQGYVHAQERFVQMDAMRRYASGRLAEVFGSSMIENDRRMRAHQFERRADEVLRTVPEAHRAMLRAYAAGVNEGLRRLGAAPPEHAALGVELKTWNERDALLMQYAMWDTLAMNRAFELMIGTMRDALPPKAVAFLTPEVSRWDVVEPGPVWTKPDMPGPDDMKPLPLPSGTKNPAPETTTKVSHIAADPEPLPLGSNSFAVAALRSGTGGAILANDMHLPLRAPAMWHRVSLAWTGGRLDGFSLPGVPGIVVGSNGNVAWGFTNVTGDYEDWIIIEPDAMNPDRYRVPPGTGENGGDTEEFGRLIEQIDVARGVAQRFEMRQTRWGPVSRTDARGRPLVLKWGAHDTARTNIRLFDLLRARTLEDALDAAASWDGPPQNVLVASKDGRIGWTVSGAIPLRAGFDGTAPTSWATPGIGWNGWVETSKKPRSIDPSSGVLFTANNRVLPVEQSRVFGRAWSSPDRAARIGELLAKKPKHDEASLLSIQLDTAREPMRYYADLARKACKTSSTGTIDTGVLSVLDSWNGTAEADQRAFALLKRFRAQLRARAFVVLLDACKSVDPRFRYSWFNDEEPLRRVLDERPPHFLPAGTRDWDALVRSCLEDAVKDLETTGPKRGLDTTWGELNRANIAHPLSGALSWVPGVSDLLDMPAVPLPGDGLTVRAQTAEFGASQRLVVSPGREGTGIAHLPGGQNGHFLSPHYRDQFESWLKGSPAPLLPGPAVETLTLRPSP